MSRIRADQLVNRAGSGGPKFPNGVADGFSVSGVVTATSYRGDGSQLTGIDASSLKDGSDVKVQAVSGGANVTGNVAATGNLSAVDVTASGNVSAVDVTASGNVSAVDATFSGNLTVNGTTTTIDTAVTAVDSLAVDGSVGIGTANPQVQLHLTAADPYIRLQDTAAPTGYSQIMGTHQGAIAFSADTSDSVADSHLRFDVDGSEKLRIDSDGKVRIGSTVEYGSKTVSDRGLIISSSGENTLKLIDTTSYAANVGACILLGGNYRASGDAQEFVKLKSFKENSTDGNYAYGFSVSTNANGGVITERLRITSGGDILPGADNTQDLGSSAKRFANIYTGDLNLSNEGSTNDVDGTWGNYTIQEGEDDLFLINRRTGKKYKFNLTEVN